MNNPKSVIKNIDIDSRVATCHLPTEYGDFKMHVFQDAISGKESVALTMGNFTDEEPVLCRVHSECLTGDIFHSLRCDCGPQLNESMKLIALKKRGVLIYLRQEGRGIGLLNKVNAYALQEKGADTVEANEILGFDSDLRDYAEAKLWLNYLGITSIKLLTNNPAKIDALKSFGFQVERTALHVGNTAQNTGYLSIKRAKMGHFHN